MKTSVRSTASYPIAALSGWTQHICSTSVAHRLSLVSDSISESVRGDACIIHQVGEVHLSLSLSLLCNDGGPCE